MIPGMLAVTAFYICICAGAFRAENVCKCPNGDPPTGSNCTTHAANMCKTCQTGWTINADKTECTRK